MLDVIFVFRLTHPRPVCGIVVAYEGNIIPQFTEFRRFKVIFYLVLVSYVC